MRRDVMGNRQDGMWTGRAGEIFGVRREEIGAVVLGDGRRGGGGALLGVWVRGDGERQSAHRLNWREENQLFVVTQQKQPCLLFMVPLKRVRPFAPLIRRATPRPPTYNSVITCAVAGTASYIR